MLESIVLRVMRVLSFDCGLKTLAWCLYDANGAGAVLRWDVVDALAGSPASLPHLEALARLLDVRSGDLFQAAFEGLGEHERAHVVIERQPGRNASMRAVEAMLHAFFVIRGKLDRERAGLRPLDTVCTFSPRLKLSGEPAAQGLRGKRHYADRKKLAVLRARQLPAVTGSPEWSAWFDGKKKKDDAADSLLQAVAYAARNPDSAPPPGAPVKRVIGRRPAPGATALTPANCKFLLRQMLYPRLRKERVGARQRLQAAVDATPLLAASVVTLFGSLDAALEELRL